MDAFGISGFPVTIQGGGRGWLNLVTCCHTCNQKKGNKTPLEASMTLIRKPLIPNASILDFYHHMDVPKQWLNFIKK